MLQNRLERAASLRGRGCTEGLDVEKTMVSNTAIACKALSSRFERVATRLVHIKALSDIM